MKDDDKRINISPFSLPVRSNGTYECKDIPLKLRLIRVLSNPIVGARSSINRVKESIERSITVPCHVGQKQSDKLVCDNSYVLRRVLYLKNSVKVKLAAALTTARMGFSHYQINLLCRLYRQHCSGLLSCDWKQSHRLLV